MTERQTTGVTFSEVQSVKAKSKEGNLPTLSVNKSVYAKCYRAVFCSVLCCGHRADGNMLFLPRWKF